MAPLKARLKTENFRTDLFRGEQNFAHDVPELLKTLAETAKTSAQSTSLFQDQTGELRRNIHISVASDSVYKLSTGLKEKYAAAVETGYRKHEITPRRGSVLRFMINGHWFSKRSVWVGPTTPRPFMETAANEAEGLAEVLADALVRRVFR